MTVSTRERLQRANEALVSINLKIQAHWATGHGCDANRLASLVTDIHDITDTYIDQEEVHHAPIERGTS